MFGEVLQRLYWLGYASAAVMFVALTLHRLLGARPIRYGVRAIILALMVSATMAADYNVGLANILLSLTVIGGLALAFWEARE